MAAEEAPSSRIATQSIILWTRSGDGSSRGGPPMTRKKMSTKRTLSETLPPREEEGDEGGIDHQRLLDLLNTKEKNLSGGLDFRNKDAFVGRLLVRASCSGARFDGADLSGVDFACMLILRRMSGLRRRHPDGSHVPPTRISRARAAGRRRRSSRRSRRPGTWPRGARAARCTAAEMNAGGLHGAEAKEAGYSLKEMKAAEGDAEGGGVLVRGGEGGGVHVRGGQAEKAAGLLAGGSGESYFIEASSGHIPARPPSVASN